MVWTVLLGAVVICAVIVFGRRLSAVNDALASHAHYLRGLAARLEEPETSGDHSTEEALEDRLAALEELHVALSDQVDRLSKKPDVLEGTPTDDPLNERVDALDGREQLLSGQVNRLDARMGDEAEERDRSNAAVARSLAVRVATLEQQLIRVRECTDSEFRSKLRYIAPWPLQQIYHFSLTLTEEFWRGTLKLTDNDLAQARTWAGPLKALPRRLCLERWRSHRVIQLYEVDGATFPGKPTEVLTIAESWGGFVVLGRMDFPKASGEGNILGAERWLELYLEDESLRLGFVGDPFGEGVRHGRSYPRVGPKQAAIFVDVPLGVLNDPRLEPYRVGDEPDEDEPEAWEPEPGHVAEYLHTDAAAGVTWSLSVQDLKVLHETEIAD